MTSDSLNGSTGRSVVCLWMEKRTKLSSTQCCPSTSDLMPCVSCAAATIQFVSEGLQCVSSPVPE